MAGLTKSLTSRQMEQALEMAQKGSPITEKGHLFLVKESNYNDALRFIKQSFNKDEPISKSIGLEWSGELQALWMSYLRQNLSLMLMNRDNGEVMAIIITGAADCYETVSDNIVDHGLRTLLTYFKFCDDKSKFFEKYDLKQAFHLFALGVSETYRNQNLALYLLQVYIDFIQNVGKPPICIKTECTSEFSKRVIEKLKFDLLYESLYSEYTADGKVVLKNMGVHTSLRAYGKIIN